VIRRIGYLESMDQQQPTIPALPQVGYGTNPYIAPPIGGPPHPQLASYHQQLQAFWGNQMREVEQAQDFKTHSLPLARIKKIMKADEDVKMISAEAPVVFAKACEMFILELTLRSWIHTEENKRRTLQKNDIAAAIGRTDIFDFLVDIVPRDEFKDEGLVIPRAAGAVPFMGPGDNVPSYYYVAQQAPNMAAYAPPTQQMRSKAPAPPHGSS
jgi:nuclear transcription factor Y gamma